MRFFVQTTLHVFTTLRAEISHVPHEKHGNMRDLCSQGMGLLTTLIAAKGSSTHRIHKAWSEFSAVWSRGNLGQGKRSI